MLLPVTLMLLLVAQSENFNYCSLNCKPHRHPGCGCQKRSPRSEVLKKPDLIVFRKKILSAHNYWRNHVASGQEARPRKGYCGQAANMMRLNYDIELEHLARCHGIKTFEYTADVKADQAQCRRRTTGDEYNQNVKPYTPEAAQTLWQLDENDHWYTQVRNLNKTTVYDYLGPNSSIDGFALMVTGHIDLLGCVRVHNEKNLPGWQYALICNYAASDGTPSLVPGKPIYQRGLKCTQCSEGTKCLRNDEFPHLCGMARPIPMDPPTAGGGKMKGWGILGVVLSYFIKRI